MSEATEETNRKLRQIYLYGISNYIGNLCAQTKIRTNDKNKMNLLSPSTVFVIAEKLPSTKTLKFSDF